MYSYLHSKGLITFSITQLPEGKELPGAGTGQIWFWARPTEVTCAIWAPKHGMHSGSKR